MDVKDMATLGGNARWKGKSKKEKSDHGKHMAEAKKAKKLSTSVAIQKPKTG